MIIDEDIDWYQEDDKFVSVKKEMVKQVEVEKKRMDGTLFTSELDVIAKKSSNLQEADVKLKQLILDEYRKFDNLKKNIAKEREMMKRRVIIEGDEVIELNV